ncbi:MAG: Ig-like domain-containing protein [Clostridia bacterium]
MKKVISLILAVSMLLGVVPGGIVAFAEVSETTLELVGYGHSGTALGTGILVATVDAPDTSGSSTCAPYVEGDTASASTRLGSTRIGVMAFSVEGADLNKIIKATLNVYVNSVNGNLGGNWMRFAVYETENPSLTYNVGGMNASDFAAVNNDYSYSAAMWSDEKFTASGSIGSTSGWAKVDVTKAVYNAVSAGKSQVVLRFQVPVNGINLSVEGDYEPYIQLISVDTDTVLDEVTATVIDGNKPVLPKTVRVKKSDGEEIISEVVWEDADYSNDTEEVKIVTVKGDASGAPATASVTVYPETFALEGMYSLKNQEDADTYMKKFPVSIEDEFIIEMDVVWQEFGDEWIMLKDSSVKNYFGPDQILFGVNSSGGFRCVDGNGTGGRNTNPDVVHTTLSTDTVYRIMIKANASTDKYSLTLTDPEGVKTTVTNYGFRTNLDVIDCLSILTNGGEYEGQFHADNIRVYCSTDTVNVTVNYTDGEKIIASTTESYIVGETLYDFPASEAFYVRIGDKAYIASCEEQSHIVTEDDDEKTYEVKLEIIHENAVLDDTYAVTASDPGNKDNSGDMLFVGASGLSNAPNQDEDNSATVGSGGVLGSARIPLLTFNIPENYKKGDAVKLNVYVANTNQNLGINNSMRIAANVVDIQVNELAMYNVGDVASLEGLLWSKDSVIAVSTSDDGKNPCDKWISIDVTEAIENAQTDKITFALYAPTAGAYIVNRENAEYGKSYEGKASYLEVCGAWTVQVSGASSITKNGSLLKNCKEFVMTENDTVRFYSENENIAAFTDYTKVYRVESDVRPVEGAYTTAILGVSTVSGAQVRYGGGVDETGKVLSGNGLRFIGKVDRNDSLVNVEGAEYGIKITAQESDVAVYIKAEKFQNEEDGIFTVALTDLKENNYNRNFTTTPYVKVDGQEFTGNDSVTRSIYKVAAGLLKNGVTASDNGEDANDDYSMQNKALINVLQAYVNQVGIRLTLKSDGTVSARETGAGAYTGDIFFNVESVKNDDGTYLITVTPDENFNTKVEIKPNWWTEYVRINNNNSVVKNNISDVTIDENGVLTFTFTTPTV